MQQIFRNYEYNKASELGFKYRQILGKKGARSNLKFLNEDNLILDVENIP
jgi:hypothetical protein